MAVPMKARVATAAPLASCRPVLTVRTWAGLGDGLAKRRPSDLRQATVHRELAGGHEAAVIRREEGRPRRDFRRFGHAPERIHRGEHLQAFLAYRGLRQFGRRRPGRQPVDPDASALPVLRPAAREVPYRGLARAAYAERRSPGGAGPRPAKGDRTP